MSISLRVCFHLLFIDTWRFFGVYRAKHNSNSRNRPRSSIVSSRSESSSIVHQKHTILLMNWRETQSYVYSAEHINHSKKCMCKCYCNQYSDQWYRGITTQVGNLSCGIYHNNLACWHLVKLVEIYCMWLGIHRRAPPVERATAEESHLLVKLR